MKYGGVFFFNYFVTFLDVDEFLRMRGIFSDFSTFGQIR